MANRLSIPLSSPTTMTKAVFTEAVQQHFPRLTEQGMEKHEAHIVIETEAFIDETGDSQLRVMMSCCAKLNTGDKMRIIDTLVQEFQLSEMDRLVLALKLTTDTGLMVNQKGEIFVDDEVPMTTGRMMN